MSLSLLDLPPELLLLILAQGDFVSLFRFARASSVTHQLVQNSREQLLRHLSFTSGLTEAASASSSTPVPRKGNGGVLTRLSVEDAQQELAAAVKAQGWGSWVHEGREVKSWEQFASTRLRIDRAWTAGTFGERFIVLNFEHSAATEAGIFRFKLLEPGRLLASGVDGGNDVWSEDGKPIWSTSLPTSPYPHVESSDAYFTQMIADDGTRELVWRQDDVAEPACRLAEADAATFAATSELHVQSAGGYLPFAVIDFPAGVSATKMRFPYLIGASSQLSQLYRVDFTTGALETIDISPLLSTPLFDAPVYYVELLDDKVMIAGSLGVTFWTPRDGLIASFPPSATPGLRLRSGHHYRDISTRPRFSAVHHDSRGAHLVATTFGPAGEHARGKIVWTCHLPTLFGGSSEAVSQRTVVLKTSSAIIQLAVENGRVAFVTQDHLHLCGLWLLNLRNFDDLEDFTRNPPKPICLAYPLPSTALPARVEMTSVEVILPASSHFASASPTGGHVEGRLRARLLRIQDLASSVGVVGPCDFAWESLEGEALSDVWGVPASQRSIMLEVEAAWSQLMHEEDVMIDGCDAFVAYQFGLPL